jgi:hypothetical protein
MRKSTNPYPPDWPEIARQVKESAGWRCVRCAHPHDPEEGYTLTVHHLDINPANCAWWNLAALCQRCHLVIQAKVVMERPWMLNHSVWFLPYAAGYYAAQYGLPTDREWVEAHQFDLIALGQGRISIQEVSRDL